MSRRLKSIVITVAVAAAVQFAAAQQINMSWINADVHYKPSSDLPAPLRADTLVRAWRGERVGLEALANAPGGMRDVRAVWKGGIPGQARFLRYTLTDDFRSCGVHPDSLVPWLVPDIVDIDVQHSIGAAESAPVWLTLEVPRDVRPGRYPGELMLTDASGAQVGSLHLTLEVQNRILPEPSAQAYQLNLWQQPYAVSRYYGVEPWSDRHFELLKPYAQMLARAGQKAISTIMFYEPWGEQSNDKFEPMVQTTRRADGSWSYDYTVFDRWVEFMDAAGVGPWIECYTMIPWDMEFRYRDEAQGGAYSTLKTTTDSPEYAELWTSFLSSLARHLKEKGWFERTLIAMDERKMDDMMRAYRIAQNAAPGIKMALAGSYHPELADILHSYTLTAVYDAFPPEVLRRRRDNGQISMLYTCCTLPKPNIFSNSDPADGAYLAVYSTAAGSDGYLHWSFMNWTDDPLADTRFKLFAPGDTYFVYPDGRTSVRYERLVEGIQLSEKIRLLGDDFRSRGEVEKYVRLQDALTPIRTNVRTRTQTTAKIVRDLHHEVDALSANE